MSCFPGPRRAGDPVGPGEAWGALLARAVEPAGVSGPLSDVIRLFGGLGFTKYLADPARARDQCISVSGTFASVCNWRGIQAEPVTGFLLARIPPFEHEAALCGHTAVRAAHEGGAGGELAVDWTARQFDPAAPVPLIVTLPDWRAFWRDPGEQAAAAAAGDVRRRPGGG